MLQKGPNRVNPLLVPLMISNMAAGNVSIQFGMRGKCINVVTACATGTHSIGEAFRTIQYGDADVMIAGGTEASITPIGVAGFTALTALSTSEDPMRASIPFDKDRNGFVMGEGQQVLWFWSLWSMLRQEAQRFMQSWLVMEQLATLIILLLRQRTEAGAAKAMEMAIADAGLKPEDVDYINAHGTSTHQQ